MNKRWAWAAVAVAAAAAVTLASLQASAAPPPPSPSGTAAPPGPLTGTELDKARATALTGAGNDAEYLSTQVQRGSSGRQAEVYYYDYATDSLVKAVVDLTSGKIVKTFSGTGSQPPASRREVSTALDLLLQNKLGDALRDAYAAATGRALTGEGDLRTTAHIYRARPADSGAAQCGRHRCLRLSVQTGDGAYLDVHDIIIDLSARTVARLK